MEINQSIWGFSPEGEAIVLYTMRNASGAAVQLSNMGAGIVAAALPDRGGRLGDIVTGYESFEGYLNDPLALGKTIGRVAGPVAGGRFTLGGIQHSLTLNVGRNHTDGGRGGFASKIWQSRVETDRVVFSLVSPDGDEGYPGEIGIEVVYDWGDDNVLEITYFARSETDTVISLAANAYWNLAGEAAGPEAAMNQILTLNAGAWLETDAMGIPTGKILPVAGTPMDFAAAKATGRDIASGFPAITQAGGFDACWAVDGWEKGALAPVASLVDPSSGRTMEVLSTMPGVRVETGNAMQGVGGAKGGRALANHDGVSIRPQGFPGALNHPEFPSQQLAAGKVYEEHTLFRFGVAE